MTTIIDLYGGPGTGKSTSAAYIYFRLKSLGKSCELVREYVKDWAWEGRKIGPYDQIYFLGKQARRESMLYGKVDYVVTDSPVYLSAYYAQMHTSNEMYAGVRGLVRQFYLQAERDGHRHHHWMLERSKPYVAEGRFQTEYQARLVDVGVQVMLENDNIDYHWSSTDENSLSEILDHVINATGGRKENERK